VVELEGAPKDQVASAMGSLAWNLYETGEFEASAQRSQEALALTPDAHWIRANLGLALLRLRQKERAVSEYHAVIQALSEVAELLIPR
jgi:Flp pilus assembly protein TadD